MNSVEYYSFKSYWIKFWPQQSREYARKRWNEYREVCKASTDYNLKDTMDYEDINICKKAMSSWSVQLAPFPVAAPCQMAACNKVQVHDMFPEPEYYQKKKGNNPMYVDNDKHIESSKINYLSDRLDGAYYNKVSPLENTFNLRTPRVPDTAEKLVEAITSGNFSIKPKNEQTTYARATDNIVWRAPSIVPDQAGYDAAVKELEDLRRTARDTIAVGTPADALTAIKALDAWTPTVTAAPVTATA